MRGFKYTEQSFLSAINVKTIGVTFNNEPTAEQKAALAFTVKSNTGSVVATAATWDGKVAKVARTNNIDFTAGTYTVEVAGVQPAYSGTVQIAARAATTLAIGAEQLPAGTTTAPLNVSLKDQYGEAMTFVGTDFTPTGYNQTQGKAVTATFNAGTKNFVIDTATTPADFKVNDQIKITFLHNATGISATKTIAVAAGVQVAEITLGEVVLPTGKTQLTQDLKGVRIPVTAKDQYGNAVDLVAGTNVSLLSSNQTRLANAALTIVKVDKQQYINIAEFIGKGDVTVQLLGLGSGVVASKALTILDAPGAIDTVVPAETQLTVAAGSSAKVALTVKDLYGTAITPANYIGKITATSTNPSVVNAPALISTQGADYGKLEIPVLVGATNGSSTMITLLVGGVAKATINVTAGATAVPSSIEVKATPAPETTLLVNGTTKIGYNVKDQYGTVMTNIGTYKITYETTSGGATVINKTKTNVTGDVSGTKTEDTITAVAQGTDALKVSLKKADDTVVDSVTTSFTVKPLSGLTYSIQDIPTLYKDGKTISTNEANAVLYGYAKEIVIKGSDGSTVPYASIVSVESNRDSDGIKIYKDAGNSKYYVVTDKVTAFGTPAADQKAIITALVNASDNLFTVTKEVTVSKDDLQVASVEFKNLAPVVANLKAANLADVTTKTLANSAAWANSANVFSGADAANSAYVWVRDQFGGFGLSYATTPVTLSVAEVSGVSTISGDTVALSATQDGKLTRSNAASAVFTANNAQFRIIASNSGKSAYITVTMADGIAPKAATTGAVSVVQATPGTYAAGDTITIKFSEAVKAANLINATGNVIQNITSDGTIDATCTIAAVNASNGYADTFTITLVGTNVLAKDKKITVAKDKAEDVAGNVNSAAAIDFVLP